MNPQTIPGWSSYKFYDRTFIDNLKADTPVVGAWPKVVTICLTEQPYVPYIETPLKNILWWAPYAFCGLLIVLGVAVLLVLTRGYV
jgi:hypothetical protein